MATKKFKNESMNKGGKNPFGKVSISAGSLIFGAGLMEAVNRWREEHSKKDSEQESVEHEEQPLKEEEEVLADNKQESSSEQSVQETIVSQQPDEPTPIDPEESGEPTGQPDPTPTVQSETPSHEESVDEIAEQIASSDELDPSDGDVVAFMNVGEHRVFYSETGEIDVFDVELNDPNLAGYPFMIADTDGDGYYDTILMVDGTPADIHIPAELGEPDTLDYYLTEARVSKSDLEEMHESGGGHLESDDPDLAYYKPGEDMIDENGETVHEESTTEEESHEPATTEENVAHSGEMEDDEDEESYLLLLAQLLEDEEEDEGNEEEGYVDVDDDEDSAELITDEEDSEDDFESA